MNIRKFIFATFLSFSLLFAGEGKAAFPVKKGHAPTEAVQPLKQEEVASDIPAINNNNETTTSFTTEKVTTKKQSFLGRLVHKITDLPKKAAVSQAAYILLSIFFLGWLAIGLNDNFEGYSWLIALLLYIILWLPGFIYSLIMMKDYY